MLFKKFIKDFATYLPAKLLPALTGFITAPILTRLLTTTEYGDYALAIGLYEFLFAFGCSGLGAGAVRFFSHYQKAGRLRTFLKTLGNSVVTIVFGGTLLASCLLWLLTPYLPAALPSLLQISILIFAVYASFNVLMQVVRAQERVQLYTRLELLANYGGLGLGLGLLYFFDLGVAGLLTGSLLAFSFALLILLPNFLSQPQAPAAQPTAAADYGELWRYAWPLALGNMGMWGLRLSDRYLIGLLRNRSEVGQYAAAYNISSKSIDILVAVFLLSLGPLVINIWERQGRAQTQHTLKMTMRIFLLLCLPAAAGLSLLARPFIQLLTAEPFHAGYQIVGFVAFSSFVYGLSQIASVGLLIAKRTLQIAFNQLLAVGLTLGLNLWLLPRYGFVAAGVTTLLGYLMLFALQAATARPYLSWPFPYRTLWRVLLATGLMLLTSGAIYALPGGWESLHVGRLLLSVVSGILVYATALLALDELDPAERQALKQAWHSLVRRRAAQV